MPRGRTRASDDGGRKPRQYVRSVPTYRFRLAVIQYVDEHGMCAALRHFYPDISGTARETKRKSVYLWAKNRAKIEALCQQQLTSELHRTRESGTATTLPKDVELDLLKWINAYRAHGAPVSALMLQRKALRVAQELGVSTAVFSASWMWRQAFLRRHSLSFRARTRQGQISPEDAIAMATKFSDELRLRMDELGVDVVYNTDQTPLSFEHISTKTIASKGVQTVWVRSGGKSKERMTCMLLGDSHGNKYEPFLVLKTTAPARQETAADSIARRHGSGKHLWEKTRGLQSSFGVQIYGNSTAWWNSELSVRFLDYHFGDRRGKVVPPVLLLWDDFSAHWTERVLKCAKELNVALMWVPPSYTSTCQPADVSWNAPLKQRLCLRWAELLHAQLDRHDNEKVATISNGYSPILVELELSERVQASYNLLAVRLEQMQLIDRDAGTVTVETDVVDSILDSLQ